MSYRNAVGVSLIEQQKPCARCGVLRFVHGNRSDLCRDCASVLTAKEKALWAA